jgi:protoheme IX farnesyltransferase
MNAGALSPGPWLRLTTIAASASCMLAVASGASMGATPHRVLAALGIPLLATVAAAALTAYPSLRAPSLAALILYGTTSLDFGGRGVHLALAALALAASLVATAATFRGEQPRPVAGSPWRDYLTLTKPRIMSLLLLTGICGMIAGARGLPSVGTMTALVVGLALACGGASALNHVLDRDIDRLMGKRTADRPVAAGRIPPSRALEFGLALLAFSFVLLAGLTNLLTAGLALVGGLFYVLVYTRWLKRSTPQNIVIGGAAGAVPPLVGWAAATGNLTLSALALFVIVLLWTPPHFWALALLIRREYAAAKIPMLPVVRGEQGTARQILLYSVALVALTVAPVAWNAFGLVYLAVALVLGGVFLCLAWQLYRNTTPRRAALLFHYSLVYLALLFTAIATDAVVSA